MMRKKAGYGKTMKKAQSGSTLKKAPAGSKGKGLRSLPKAVRNKMGYAKKGKTVTKKAKSGGRMKKCKYGCK
jgi:protoporphyrinogen oxidase